MSAVMPVVEANTVQLLTAPEPALLQFTDPRTGYWTGCPPITNLWTRTVSQRMGIPNTPSSRDLLFCACSQGSELSRALETIEGSDWQPYQPVVMAMLPPFPNSFPGTAPLALPPQKF